MALHRVWIATASDGLVRADQVIGIGCHATPRIAGKSPHWLLVVNLAVPAGSGSPGEWDVGMLNRTVCQTAAPQVTAAAELAQLLARLDEASPAGIVRPTTTSRGDGDVSAVHFGFVPFPGADVAAVRDRLERTPGTPDEYL